MTGGFERSDGRVLSKINRLAAVVMSLTMFLAVREVFQPEAIPICPLRRNGGASIRCSTARMILFRGSRLASYCIYLHLF